MVASQQKITRPNHVSLEISGASVVMGQYTTDVLFRDATIQKRNPSIMKIPVIPGRSIVYVRWIVIGDGSGRVVVDSVKGGQAQQEFSIAPADRSGQ